MYLTSSWMSTLKWPPFLMIGPFSIQQGQGNFTVVHIRQIWFTGIQIAGKKKKNLSACEVQRTANGEGNILMILNKQTGVVLADRGQMKSSIKLWSMVLKHGISIGLVFSLQPRPCSHLDKYFYVQKVKLKSYFHLMTANRSHFVSAECRRSSTAGCSSAGRGNCHHRD